MKLPTLAMTKRTHEMAFQYLFPDDGLEAAGVFLCNQGSGKYHQRLVVTEFLGLPHELSERHPNLVTWPFEAYFDPARITELDGSGQSIVTVHSHPGGESRFSRIDDINDRELFRSVNEWFDNDRVNGAAIMMPDGSIIARAVNSVGKFQRFSSVIVVGDTIQVWKKTPRVASTAYGTKLSQTFGKGTLDRLRSMKVGVIGCSGTGSIMIELLVRNCVGELVVVDDDILEEKNLNRMVNSTATDARKKLPKVSAIEKAVENIGLDTKLETYCALTDSPDVVSALVDCDVIFGCVDSAFGRYHLECLASAYLIPYFDLGVHIEADGTGDITAADAVAHYVHPDGGSLWSRGAYQIKQVTAENWQRSAPDHYAQQRSAGYLAAVGEEQPAVMSLNMQAACMAFNDFMARLHSFRLDNDREFATQRFRLVHGDYEYEADNGTPHPIFKRYKGTGDASLLVQNNTRHD